MVTYKTRVFCEPEDGDSLGAEVRIYGEEGDVIDTILITTQSQYDQLATQIQNIDNTYIDQQELVTLLSDTENPITVNATSLGGVPAADYARLNHNDLHIGTFAPKNHASTSNGYGLGDGTNYGHTKVVNNLTTASFQSGEALSAAQGKVLNTAINNVKKSLTTWNSQKLGYGLLHVNPAIRCCRYKYERENYKITGDKKLHEATIPEEYRPKGIVRAWDSKYVCLSVNTGGDVHIETTHSQLPVINTLKVNFIWFY